MTSSGEMYVGRLTFKRCSLHKSDRLNWPDMLLTAPMAMRLRREDEQRSTMRKKKTIKTLFVDDGAYKRVAMWVNERETVGRHTTNHEISGKPAFHDFFEDGGLGVVLARRWRWTVGDGGLDECIPSQVAGEEEGARRHYMADGGLHAR